MVRCCCAVVCCDAVGGWVSVFVVALLVEAGGASRGFGAGGVGVEVVAVVFVLL